MPATLHAKRSAAKPRAPKAPVRLVIPVRDETPEELAVRAQTGSLEAFERLVTLFEGRLFNFLLRRVDAAEAEDLAQETFIRAWERINQYSPRWKFSTWLFTIATRQTSSRLRRQRSGIPLETAQPAASPVEAGAGLIRAEEQGRVWTLVESTLAEEQRTAVWLRYVEDMSMQDIARVMGKTQVGVRVMLHRARLTLAHALEQRGLGPEPRPDTGASP